MPRRTTHYDTLGLQPDASDAEIRAAYLRLARRAHPDTGAADGGTTMAGVNEAYRVLGRPTARRAYDVELTRRSAADVSDVTEGVDAAPDEHDEHAVGPTRSGPVGRVLTPGGPARMPWRLMAICGVVGASIVLISSFFADPPGEEVPDGILRVGSCVIGEGNDSVREVACSVDGALVVDLVLPSDSDCPAAYLRYRDRLTSSTVCVGAD
jgi:molecular chaperone DnaJ